MQASEKMSVAENMTISRRGKLGIWTADYHVINGDGRRQHGRKSLKTRLRRVAEQRARELAQKLENQELGTSVIAPVPVEIAVKEFLQSKASDGRARKTLMKYGAELKLFGEYLKAEYGVTTVLQITARHANNTSCREGIRSAITM